MSYSILTKEKKRITYLSFSFIVLRGLPLFSLYCPEAHSESGLCIVPFSFLNKVLFTQETVPVFTTHTIVIKDT